MSFGRRTEPPSRALPSSGTARRPGRGGYPLGVLTVGVVGYLNILLMAMIPYFTPTDRSVAEVASSSVVAVLNVVVVAAIILGLTDVILRLFKFSAVWAYAMTSGVLTFCLCFWLASVLSSGSSANFPAFLAMMVLVPAGAGGAVLGLFRR